MEYNRNLLPYLIFNGNCKEVMNFYAETLKGEITKMQQYKDAPIDNPAQADDRIFDSEVVANNVIIKASDSFPNQEVSIGTNISLFLVFADKEDQRGIYETLAKEGKVAFPLNDQTGFAMLTDKFGISWMLAFEG